MLVRDVYRLKYAINFLNYAVQRICVDLNFNLLHLEAHVVSQYDLLHL